MTAPATIHVVDDDEGLRESLAFLLDVNGFNVRSYASGLDLLARAAELESGCILTDVRMPEINGLDLVARLPGAGQGGLPIIMMTGHADVPMAVAAMKAGVADFIEKPFPDNVLLKAIADVLAGVTTRGGGSRASAEAQKRLAGLSAREQDVLHGLVAGKSNKVIAIDLGISPRTVEVYRAHLMTKTGAGSLSELVRLALAAGLA